MAGMCGRFAVTMDPALLARRLGAVDETGVTGLAGAERPDYPIRNYNVANYNVANYNVVNYNVAPTATVATVVARHTDPEDTASRRVRLMRWGLVPPWVTPAPDGTPATRRLLFNARADTVTTSAAFRSSATYKRCLVPMDGWYEWRAEPPTAVDGRAVRTRKTPFFIHRTDGGPLLVAGLWSVWRNPRARSGPPLLSCTIITTDAVGELAEIHDRMPLPVAEADWDAWLNPDTPADAALLAGPPDIRGIAAREVSTLVNNVRNNGPELLAPAGSPPGAPTLL